MGISHPINNGLFKIMGQLGFVEQTGHGNLVFIDKYGKEAFNIRDNYITVTIPFSFSPSMKQIDVNGLSPSHMKVIFALKDNPSLTQKELSKFCDIGTTRLSEIIRDLKSLGRIERIGAKKKGYWKVN